MQKWEYKVLRDPSESELNQLGWEGWELVGVVASEEGYVVRAYLKRPRG